MSDATIFVLAFAALLLGRVAVATVVFLFLLPRGDRCPICDDETLRVQRYGWNTLLPWFRTSWCPACGWSGLLRHGPLTVRDVPEPVESGTRGRDR
ncbi:MAG: hypothetical protein HYX65_02270 [Gemmatimonadetes bacterium]|nr:hypothetical protein [Gemmatimonadota bacterium]